MALRLLLFLCLASHLWAAQVKVYFSPDGGCTDAIVQEIKGARSEILVQGYSFTSDPIAKALIQANKRGVHVEAVLDKTNEKPHSKAEALALAGIPVWIDFQPAIAHSKVMIIDRKTVISGSFNFTQAAERRNVENLLFMRHAPALVKKYSDEFESRKKVSRRMSGGASLLKE